MKPIALYNKYANKNQGKKKKQTNERVTFDTRSHFSTNTPGVKVKSCFCFVSVRKPSPLPQRKI